MSKEEFKKYTSDINAGLEKLFSESEKLQKQILINSKRFNYEIK